jgi:hypothetical protein
LYEIHEGESDPFEMQLQQVKMFYFKERKKIFYQFVTILSFDVHIPIHFFPFFFFLGEEVESYTQIEGHTNSVIAAHD